MSGNYRRQKGTRAFGEQPGRQSNDRWDKDLDTIDEPRIGDSCLIRPVGGVLTVGVHYIAFRSPKDGKMKGYFELCPNWSLADQDEIDRNCPVCQYFHPFLRLKDDKKYGYLKMGLKYRYVFHAFNLTNIKNKTKPIFGVVQTHRLGMEQIEKAFKIKGYGPDHPKKGYGLHWLVEPAKQKRFNKETTFTPGDNIPVMWDEENGVWKIKVGKKTYKGKEQDLLTAIPKPPTSADVNKKLGDLGLFDVLNQAVEGGVSRTSVPAAPADDDEWNEGSTDAGEDWEEPDDKNDEVEDEDWEEPEEELDETSDEDEWEEDEDEEEDAAEDTDEDDEEVEDDDDDEWEDEDEDEEDEVEDDDEEDDEVEDEDEDDEWEDEEEVEDEEEEEPEPPKKKSSKKGGKKKGGKKTDKKKASGKKGKGGKKKKQAEPEDEDDDEWDDDWD